MLKLEHLNELLEVDLAVAVLVKVVAELLGLVPGEVVSGVPHAIHQLLLRQQSVLVHVHVAEHTPQLGLPATHNGGGGQLSVHCSPRLAFPGR